MAQAAPPGLGLELGFASSADTGDVFTAPEFDVSFGDKIAGRGASGSGNIAMEIAKGVAIALAAKFAWEMLR